MKIQPLHRSLIRLTTWNQHWNRAQPNKKPIHALQPSTHNVVSMPRRSNCILIAGCCLIAHCILNFGAFWDATASPSFLQCTLDILIQFDMFPKRNLDPLGKMASVMLIWVTSMTISRSKSPFLRTVFHSHHKSWCQKHYCNMICCACVYLNIHLYIYIYS